MSYKNGATRTSAASYSVDLFNWVPITVLYNITNNTVDIYRFGTSILNFAVTSYLTTDNTIYIGT